MRDNKTAPFAAISILFFLSGAVALVYEVLWQRQFSLLFGSSAPATAAVLAAYFTGLSSGTFLFGRLARNWSRPLLGYGALELMIGAGAMLAAPVLSCYSSVYPAFIARFGNSPALLIVLKGVLAFVAIALPTFAMGATFPALAHLLDLDRSRLGNRVALLYLLNTAGAALGTVAVPALLLPALGMRQTLLWCVSLNLLIGITALLLGRRSNFQVARAEKPARTAIHRPMLELSFLSGFGLFALQVLWNRAFAQVHDNSLSAFAVITAVFILAIAAGAQLARVVLTPGNLARNFGILWCVGGIITLVAPYLFLHLTHQLAYASPVAYNFLLPTPLFTSAAVLIFIPVALLSSGLPILIQQVAAQSGFSASQITGSLIGVNTLGCICGALTAGFLLPQTLGLWRSIALLGAAFSALGTPALSERRFASLLARFQPAPRSIALRLFGGLLLFIALTIDLPRTSLGTTETLLELKEGPYGISAAIQRADRSRRLKLNNHYVLGGTLSTGDQRMQAHIPLVISPAARGRALFLGYGTGITAGGALFHPTFDSTAIELVPDVAALASTYFADENRHFGTAGNSRLILDDARNFLRGTDQKFNVIIGDLVVPWRPGESTLYTLEHFLAVRSALATNAVFCAWIPMFQLRQSQFEVILRTFLEVFEHAYLWRGDFSPTQPAYGLVAFASGQPLVPGAIPAALEQMQPDPQNPQLRASAAFWIHFIGELTRADLPKPLPPLNSEDTPYLELNTARFSSTPHFVGRSLQTWENKTRDSSAQLISSLPSEARLGCEAGRQLVEYTLLLSEGRDREAAAVQNKLRSILGDRTFELIFGHPQP